MRTVTVPRGTELTCKNWQSEAAYRMIQHNLDPENAEKVSNGMGSYNSIRTIEELFLSQVSSQIVKFKI